MSSFFLWGLVAFTQISTQAFAASIPVFEIASDTDYATRMTIENGELAVRSQLVHDKNGNITYDGIQDRYLIDGRISFFRGAVRIDFSAGTGKSFDLSYDRTGIGTGDFAPTLNVRKLSLTASPGKDVELTLGSFAPSYGAGSENTYLDSDGYLTGYRVKAKIEGGDLIVTLANLGDFNTPDVFKRFRNMDDLNYAQILFAKNLTSTLKSSIEFDQVKNDSFARGALALNLSKWTDVLQSINIEAMMPLTATNTESISAGATFALSDRITLTETYEHANLSSNFPLGDHIFSGNSIRSVLKVAQVATFPGGSMSAFIDYVQSLDTVKRSRLEIGIQAKLN